MQKITTFLWFDDNAEEAVSHYASIFKNARTIRTMRYTEAGPGPQGGVMTIHFELDGQEFIALNGGPHFTFTEAVSLLVRCENQEEVDYFWDRLSAGGQPGPCGWLKDKFGLSWQITPTILLEMLDDPDQAKSSRVMAAMLQMGKIDIEELRRAYAG